MRPLSGARAAACRSIPERTVPWVDRQPVEDLRDGRLRWRRPRAHCHDRLATSKGNSRYLRELEDALNWPIGSRSRRTIWGTMLVLLAACASTGKSSAKPTSSSQSADTICQRLTNRLAPGDQVALALSTTAEAVTAELSPSDSRRNTWARLAPHHVVVECSYLDPMATPSALASCPRGNIPLTSRAHGSTSLTSKASSPLHHRWCREFQHLLASER